MADTKHPGEGENNPLVGHEETDVNAKAVSAAGLAILGLTVTIVFAMWFLFNFLGKMMSEPRPGARHRASSEVPRQPPEPRLQASPVLDYKEIRKTEDELLNGYGWIDPDRGAVRIPVARALEIVAQKGLPARPASPAPQPRPGETVGPGTGGRAVSDAPRPTQTPK